MGGDRDILVTQHGQKRIADLPVLGKVLKTNRQTGNRKETTSRSSEHNSIYILLILSVSLTSIPICIKSRS